MAIMGRFSHHNKVIPPNASFRITEQGREKLQEFGGDPKSRILVALETRGTSDIPEIAQQSGVSRGGVERLIPQLVRGGYVQYINTSMGTMGPMDGGGLD